MRDGRRDYLIRVYPSVIDTLGVKNRAGRQYTGDDIRLPLVIGAAILATSRRARPCINRRFGSVLQAFLNFASALFQNVGRLAQSV